MTYIHHIPDIKQMHENEHNRPPLPVNDTQNSYKTQVPFSEQKIPTFILNDIKYSDKYHMSDSDHNRPTLSDNNTNMPDDEQMPAKNQMR